MRRVSEDEILKRLKMENSWWVDRSGLDRRLENMRERAYLAPFFDLVTNRAINRAIVLMGPRRVGKSVMLRQTVRKLLEDQQVDPQHILFASLEHPIYRSVPLDRILHLYLEAKGLDGSQALYVLFDEIQYVENWENYLQPLVEEFPNIRFVVCGSAAAAIKMKNRESAAGRMTDFLLPPLLFKEFLEFRDVPESPRLPIDQLNKHFIDYLNFGGYPEAVLHPAIRNAPMQYVAEDIIEKVLMRDLPSLYGIHNPNELNRLFAHLVYNTGLEVTIGELSDSTGLPNKTLYKYLDYLESAFLIHRLYRVDRHGKHPKTNSTFKVYVSNPSVMVAFFGPIADNDERMGRMARTAVIAQLIHSKHVNYFNYSSWKDGDVDFVLTTPDSRIASAMDIKWSDGIAENNDELKDLVRIAKSNGLTGVQFLSKSIYTKIEVDGVAVICAPIVEHCMALTKFLIEDQLAKGIRPRTLLDGIAEE